MHWYDDRNNMWLLFKYLIHEEQYSAEDLLYVLEKPWKYDDEFKKTISDEYINV